MLNANQITTCLPHRYPMLLIDRILHIEEGVGGIGLKNVTMNESYFEGHFPGEPVMPGGLVIESMAQTAAAVFSFVREDGSQRNPGKRPRFLVRIQSMKFRKKVTPGDQLVIEVRMIKQFGPMLKIFAEAQVHGEVVASGSLTFSG